MTSQHIILIGFKNTGKSTVGRLLAQKLDYPFFDSDKEIESFFYKTHQKKYNCREIMQHYGADFFKEMETTTVKTLASQPPSVIAMGGGTPLQAENQALIAPHIIIHITAPPDIVFERIMKNGPPAFFPPEIDPRVTFDQLWEERNKIYHQLTSICVENSADIYGTVEEIYQFLSDTKT